MIDEPEGRVRAIEEPSGSVSVWTIDEATGLVETGPTVRTEPFEVMVWRLAIVESDGRVKVTSDPSGSVSVSTFSGEVVVVGVDAGL